MKFATQYGFHEHPDGTATEVLFDQYGGQLLARDFKTRELRDIPLGYSLGEASAWGFFYLKVEQDFETPDNELLSARYLVTCSPETSAL